MLAPCVLPNEGTAQFSVHKPVTYKFLRYVKQTKHILQVSIDFLSSVSDSLTGVGTGLNRSLRTRATRFREPYRHHHQAYELQYLVQLVVTAVPQKQARA